MKEIEQPDTQLMLMLALWNYNHGFDEVAWSYLAKAKGIDSSNVDVLRVEIYFSYGYPELEILKLCLAALSIHPDDPWIKSVCNQMETNGQIEEMILPPIGSKWLDIDPPVE